jgi:hypothetical protein
MYETFRMFLHRVQNNFTFFGFGGWHFVVTTPPPAVVDPPPSRRVLIVDASALDVMMVPTGLDLQSPPICLVTTVSKYYV